MSYRKTIKHADGIYLRLYGQVREEVLCPLNSFAYQAMDCLENVEPADTS